MEHVGAAMERAVEEVAEVARAAAGTVTKVPEQLRPFIGGYALGVLTVVISIVIARVI